MNESMGWGKSAVGRWVPAGTCAHKWKLIHPSLDGATRTMSPVGEGLKVQIGQPYILSLTIPSLPFFPIQNPLVLQLLSQKLSQVSPAVSSLLCLNPLSVLLFSFFYSNVFSPVLYISSGQFSCSVVSDSLRPHGLQYTRPPRPSLTPRVCETRFHIYALIYDICFFLFLTYFAI